MLNRLQLYDTLQRRITTAIAGRQPLGLLVLRTQRVREINLLLGYETGERAAHAMRAVIMAALREDDEIIQIGECDFAVMLPSLRNREHVALAAAKLIRVLQSPLDIGGTQILPSAVIGAAVCPDDGTDADLLLRLADSACDVAIATGDRFALHVAPDFSTAFAHGDLRHAIAANHLQLFLQPIADLRTGRIDRVEALSRWDHPDLGSIPPDRFILVAEQTGLIAELTRWNINASLRQAGDAVEGDFALRMSINLSVRVLQHASFLEQFRDMLRMWKVPADHVVLEVTETGLMEDLQQCERMLFQLRDLGVGIAIDDFGTGYSSMAYLKRLPVDEIKIDKSFIIDMQQDIRAEKLVASMIDVGHHLGMSIVAEGVEDQPTLERLCELGCDYAQGFHISRPAPAEHVVKALLASATL